MIRANADLFFFTIFDRSTITSSVYLSDCLAMASRQKSSKKEKSSNFLARKHDFLAGTITFQTVFKVIIKSTVIPIGIPHIIVYSLSFPEKCCSCFSTAALRHLIGGGLTCHHDSVMRWLQVPSRSLSLSRGIYFSNAT
jgi:hypothetical protein